MLQVFNFKNFILCFMFLHNKDTYNGSMKCVEFVLWFGNLLQEKQSNTDFQYVTQLHKLNCFQTNNTFFLEVIKSYRQFKFCLDNNQAIDQ